MGGGKGRLFRLRKRHIQAPWQVLEERCPQHPCTKDKEITEKVEGFMLFAADENGNYDKEELFDDAMNVFKSMKPHKFEQGFIKGTIGEGSILIELPDNGLMNFILGDTNAIRITEADFLELKSIFTE